MTDKDTRKKGIGWFKGFDQEQSQWKPGNLDQQAGEDRSIRDKQNDNIKESGKNTLQSEHNLFSKDNQDKVVLDLIVSLENMIKDRELVLYRNKDLDNQLLTANENINRIKQDLMKNEQALLERNKEIRGLETNLTNKQMSYDQLLEDYKDYQNTSTADYEKVSIQLDTEINKYSKLNEELMNSQYQNMLKITEFEETVRILKIENEQYKQQYDKVVKEKSELMNTINDFTDRMSFSFSPKSNTNSSEPNN